MVGLEHAVSERSEGGAISWEGAVATPGPGVLLPKFRAPGV